MRLRSLSSRAANAKRLTLEALEHRMPLSADGLISGLEPKVETVNSTEYESTAYEMVEDNPVSAGDANRDGLFDQRDLVQVFLAGKYSTADAANWSEGDWNGDNVFDQQDIVAAFKTGLHRSLGAAALAQGATQISGISYFDESDVCGSGSVGADFAVLMTGDLEGCLYTFVETAESSPSGTYRETGTEVFVDSDGDGTFATTYRFEAKYEDVDNLVGEIFGRCQHVVLEGSGTGIFEDVTGRIDFNDDIDEGNFPYKGHLRW